MRRSSVLTSLLAMASVGAFPAGLGGQAAGASAADGPARRSVGVFGGYAFGYTIPSRSIAFLGEGAVQFQRDWRLDARGVFGVDGTLPIAPRFLVLASWRFEPETTGAPECSGIDVETLALIACDGLAIQGPNTIGYVGVGGILGRRLPLTLHAGPTVTTGATSASRLGLMFGATLDVPTPRAGFVLRLAAEDRLAFWRNDDSIVDASGTLDGGPNHLLALRAGVAFRP
ncbi:MAG TPA: hypothetical protein VK837_01860 [Longimicrobiales bacterium]|nr:hypothetical protein [Longimicrobiales bacterium]